MTYYEFIADEEARIQRRRARKFANALAIYDDALVAYHRGAITYEQLQSIAEELDL